MGQRRIGRPKSRWMDGVLEDIRRLEIINWWMVARKREIWKKILREALP